MTNQMKQRIVGVVVIVAILAICLPIFFHQTEKAWQSSSLSAKIPAEPVAPKIALGPPQPTPMSQLVVANQVIEKKQAVNSLLIGHQQKTDAATTTEKAVLSQPVVAVRTVNAAAPIKSKTAVVSSVNNKPVVAPVVQAKAMARSQQGGQAAAVLLENPPQAWVVQLASFSNKDNANRLITQLRKSGFDAYLRSNASGNKMLIRVFVGPEINVNKAKSLQKQLQNKFNLQGVVRKYKV